MKDLIRRVRKLVAGTASVLPAPIPAAFTAAGSGKRKNREPYRTKPPREGREDPGARRKTTETARTAEA